MLHIINYINIHINRHQVTATYLNVITSEQTCAHVTLTIRRTEGSNLSEKRDFEVDKQHNRIIAAEAMEQANDLAKSGNLEQVR